MNCENESTPFYGKTILKDEEKELIEKILEKYKNEPVTDLLKKRIWNDLQTQKYLGHITIPFKVVMKRDPMGKFPNFIEIILDSKL